MHYLRRSQTLTTEEYEKQNRPRLPASLNANDWDTEDLRTWLSKQGFEGRSSKHICNMVYLNRIDGIIFMSITPAEIDEIFRRLGFDDRSKLFQTSYMLRKNMAKLFPHGPSPEVAKRMCSELAEVWQCYSFAPPTLQVAGGLEKRKPILQAAKLADSLKERPPKTHVSPPRRNSRRGKRRLGKRGRRKCRGRF